MLTKKEELPVWAPLRQNRVYAKLSSFARMRTATQGSVSFFPFWLIKEKSTLIYGAFLINKCC
jgi:hypothetical protein